MECRFSKGMFGLQWVVRQLVQNLEYQSKYHNAPLTVKFLQAKGLLVGGNGAFRADGRTQFGCRQLVSSLNPVMDGNPHFPVAFWDCKCNNASSLLNQYLTAHNGNDGEQAM